MFVSRFNNRVKRDAEISIDAKGLLYFQKHIQCIYIWFERYLEMTKQMAEQSKKTKTNKKDGQLLIRINSAERDEFLQLCESLDTSAARELRKFIRSFVQKHQSAEPSNKE